MLTKIVYYKSFKTNMSAIGLAIIIINIVIRHNNFVDSILYNNFILFTSKFYLSLCYLLGIKQKLFTFFYSQIDGPTKGKNSIFKVYF